MKLDRAPGSEAVRVKGWLAAHRWLLLRRSTQLGILGLFLLGPLAGIWIIEGNLASSLTLGVMPMTDPLILLQSLAAGHLPSTTACLGAGLVVLLYAVVGGRSYCAWVCPVNLISDAAASLRAALGLRQGWQPRASTRYWLLLALLVASAVSGVIAWELVNPITMTYRAALFGVGAAWAVLLVVFLFDLLLSRNSWCSRICPVGAFYGLIGTRSAIRVSAFRRSACDDCMDCFAVCPEPQVIPPALRGEPRGSGPVILDRDCTNCGRCIDVCARDVYRFGWRGDHRLEPAVEKAGEQRVRAVAAGAASDGDGTSVTSGEAA